MTLCLSAAFGVLRGRTMPIWRDRDGTILRPGDRSTLLLWLATITTRLALGAIVLTA